MTDPVKVNASGRSLPRETVGLTFKIQDTDPTDATATPLDEADLGSWFLRRGNFGYGGQYRDDITLTEDDVLG